VVKIVNEELITTLGPAAYDHAGWPARLREDYRGREAGQVITLAGRARDAGCLRSLPSSRGAPT
jgi:hypothetical protein